MIEIKDFRFTNDEKGLTCFLGTRDLREGFNFLDRQIRGFFQEELIETWPNQNYLFFGVDCQEKISPCYSFPRGFEDNQKRGFKDSEYLIWDYNINFSHPLKTAYPKPYTLAFANLQTIPALKNSIRLALLVKFSVDNGKNRVRRVGGFYEDEYLTKGAAANFHSYLFSQLFSPL